MVRWNLYPDQTSSCSSFSGTEEVRTYASLFHFHIQIAKAHADRQHSCFQDSRTHLSESWFHIQTFFPSQLTKILPTILTFVVEFPIGLEEVEFKRVELRCDVDGEVTTFESLNLFSWLVTPPTTPEMTAQMTIMRMNLFVLAVVTNHIVLLRL